MILLNFQCDGPIVAGTESICVPQSRVSFREPRTVSRHALTQLCTYFVPTQLEQTKSTTQ